MVRVNTTSSKIRATAIVFRHGQRTSITVHPKLNNPLNKELGNAQLTPVGARQMYDNGVLLRSRYQHLLPADGLFRQSNMRITCSVPERTMMSLQSFMAGFMPAPKDNALPLNWQPFHCSVDHSAKIVHFNPRSNPEYKKALWRIIGRPSGEFLEWTRKDAAVIKELSRAAGDAPLNTLMELGMFADLLKTQLLMDPEPPQWAVDVYRPTMSKYLDYFFQALHATPEMVKIRGGPLLTEIVRNMVAVEEGNQGQGRNVLIYSAHDITLLSLAYALGVEAQVPKQPFYSDTMMVDLLENGQVQVVYLNTGGPEPTFTVLDVPGCGGTPTLSEFKETVRAMLDDDGAEPEVYVTKL